MTYKYVLKVLALYQHGTPDQEPHTTNLDDDVCRMIRKAIYKQITKDVVPRHEYAGACPWCGTIYNNTAKRLHPDYCGHCGQKINWSSVEAPQDER